MAGFMSGFGRAFQSSFQEAATRRANREDELFRVKFTQFTKDMDEYKTTKKQQDAAAKAAKELAIEGGQPDAAPWLYQRILTFGLDDTAQLVRDGRLSKTEMSPNKPIRAERAISDELNTQFQKIQPKQDVDPFANDNPRINQRLSEVIGGDYQKMQQDMMTGPSSPFGDQEAGGWTFMPEKPQPVKVGSLEQANFDLMKAVESDNPAAIKDARMRVEAIKMAAYQEYLMDPTRKPQDASWVRIRDPNTGQFVLRQGVRSLTPDGNETVRIVGPNGPMDVQEFIPSSDEEAKQFLEVFSKSAPVLKTYNEKATGMIELLDTGGRLIDIVQQDPRILTQAAGFTEQVTTIFREAEIGLDILNTTLNGEQFVQAAKELGPIANEELANIKKVEDELGKILSTEVRDIGRRKAAFDALIKLTAYKAARMEGQDGRGASDFDIQNFLQIAGGANDPQKFIDSFANMANGYLNSLETQRQIATQNTPDLQSFEQLFGWKPDLEAQRIEDLVNNSQSPFTKSAFEILRARNNLSTDSGEPITNTKPSTQQNSQPQPVVPTSQYPTPSAAQIDLARKNKNSPNMKRVFQQRYGQEAWDRLIENNTSE